MKSKILFALVVVGLTALFACTKMKESTLEGRWKKIEIDSMGKVAPLTIWEFKSGELIVYSKEASANLIEESRVKYTLGFNGAEYTLNLTQMVSGDELYTIRGNGRIVKLNDKYLKWFNENEFYAEFVRYE